MKLSKPFSFVIKTALLTCACSGILMSCNLEALTKGDEGKDSSGFRQEKDNFSGNSSNSQNNFNNNNNNNNFNPGNNNGGNCESQEKGGPEFTGACKEFDEKYGNGGAVPTDAELQTFLNNCIGEAISSMFPKQDSYTADCRSSLKNTLTEIAKLHFSEKGSQCSGNNNISPSEACMQLEKDMQSKMENVKSDCGEEIMMEFMNAMGGDEQQCNNYNPDNNNNPGGNFNPGNGSTSKDFQYPYTFDGTMPSCGPDGCNYDTRIKSCPQYFTQMNKGDAASGKDYEYICETRGTKCAFFNGTAMCNGGLLDLVLNQNNNPAPYPSSSSNFNQNQPTSKTFLMIDDVQLRLASYFGVNQIQNGSFDAGKVHWVHWDDWYANMHATENMNSFTPPAHYKIYNPSNSNSSRLFYCTDGMMDTEKNYADIYRAGSCIWIPISTSQDVTFEFQFQGNLSRAFILGMNSNGVWRNLSEYKGYYSTTWNKAVLTTFIPADIKAIGIQFDTGY